MHNLLCHCNVLKRNNHILYKMLVIETTSKFCTVARTTMSALELLLKITPFGCHNQKTNFVATKNLKG